MILTKYIGRLALFVLIGLAFSSFYSVADALTLPQNLSLSGLTFSKPIKPTGLIDARNRMITLNIRSENALEISNIQKPAVIEDLTFLTSVKPQDSAPQAPHLIRQVEAAEITEAVVTETPTPTPTDTPTPTVATSSPSTTGNSSSGGLNADVLFSMANAHRAAIGKPPFETDPRVCTLARDRAPEIAEEIANGHMHSGMYGRHLPYWNTENIITMNNETAAFNWWINDYIHRIALEGDYKYSCVACSGNACAQEFTNFAPK